MMNNNAELVFIPAPGFGHLASTLEIANLLVDRDHRLSITVLIIKLPFDYNVPQSSSSKRIKFIELPHEPVPPQLHVALVLKTLVENQIPHVRKAITELTLSNSAPDSPRLAGFVIDMFCTSMIDVANEFHVPTYLFYTSGAAFLGFQLRLQEIYDQHNQDNAEFLNSGSEFTIPSFVNPVPARVVPSVALNTETAKSFHDHARRFRETKGIMVNTFSELESYAVGSFLGWETEIPPVYPVGPILSLKRDDSDKGRDILKWLDNQPEESVLFLCFGSMGSFCEEQVKEIAIALEKSGVRFLWSLRQPAPKDQIALPTDYTNPTVVLPDGFHDRTAGIGKVIGWAPQVDVLAHKAIGGFVSHCGWNSTLESIWFGVPIATWPIYAEQQTNAFELVVELGLAVEITLDYRKVMSSEKIKILSAEEIECGIRKLMDGGDGEIIRKRVKDASQKSREVLMNGGSSFSSLNRFIDNVFANVPS